MCIFECLTENYVMRFDRIFFFKQKTAYEMRISDWSSDVCSSDLEVTGTVPDFAINPTALREAVGQHPDLNAAIARTRQAEADVAAARATKRPDWSFDVAYQRRADRYGDMVSAGVTLDRKSVGRERVCQYV